MVSHPDDLLSEWSLIRVISHQSLSSGWSLIRVVSHKGGLSSKWSFIRVVSCHGFCCRDRRPCCSLPAEGMLPMWAGAALRECLRLHRHSDDNVLSIIGLALDKDRFHIIYPYMQNRTLKDHIVDAKKVGENTLLLLD